MWESYSWWFRFQCLHFRSAALLGIPNGAWPQNGFLVGWRCALRVGAVHMRIPGQCAELTLDCGSMKGGFVSRSRKVCLQSSQPFFRGVLPVYNEGITVFCGRWFPLETVHWFQMVFLQVCMEQLFWLFLSLWIVRISLWLVDDVPALFPHSMYSLELWLFRYVHFWF